ncbi:MAG TPA: hypothetical protein VFS50_01395 [Meiothermus sp.]|jgi:hypothetical protein|nr:hypothetical protein [Meiothermus sp.]
MFASNWQELEFHSKSKAAALRREALQNRYEFCLWRNRVAGWLKTLSARLDAEVLGKEIRYGHPAAKNL